MLLTSVLVEQQVGLTGPANPGTVTVQNWIAYSVITQM